MAWVEDGAAEEEFEAAAAATAAVDPVSVSDEDLE